MSRIFFAALIATTAACAQTPAVQDSGRLFGQVWSAGSCGAKRTPEEIERLGCGGKPVQTLIVVRSVTGDFVREVRSGPDGKYSLEVPPGEYRLSVEAQGLRTRGAARGAVAAGESKELWLHLGSMAK